MVRRWDEDGFERIRYTDLCDATHLDPTETHYFKYLEDLGLSDFYEEGSARPGQEYTMDGSAPAKLPYQHSIEHYTGNESLAFLKERDDDRPFFLHMSFQRPMRRSRLRQSILICTIPMRWCCPIVRLIILSVACQQARVYARAFGRWVWVSAGRSKSRSFEALFGELLRADYGD